jgi:hypothetical protein
MYISSKQIDLLMSFRSATLLRVWQYIPVAFLFVVASFLLKRNEPGKSAKVSVH